MKQKVLVAMVTLMATVLAAGLAIAPSTEQAPTNVEFRQASGKINYMRIQQVGETFEPPSDSIAIEVVIKIDTLPANAFGFSVRNNANLLSHQGMLDILRDAFFNNHPVTIEYNIIPPKTNGILLRASVQK
jgi:hypothetical protein